MTADMLDVSTHFRFGENWSRYADLVDERRIADAIDSVSGLVGDLSGKTFLDIGSGSGLFSVAALRLGASRVVAIDIDEDSVATTRRLLSKEERTNWTAERMSVFDVAVCAIAGVARTKSPADTSQEDLRIIVFSPPRTRTTSGLRGG